MVRLLLIPQRYEFSSKSQQLDDTYSQADVVADTTKVRIFKQITTCQGDDPILYRLLLIPQRYEFSSKSQHKNSIIGGRICCCWYHKGTNFQANHNQQRTCRKWRNVVADTTKVRIFKQITTNKTYIRAESSLLLIPQRYEFSSKSQHSVYNPLIR